MLLLSSWWCSPKSTWELEPPAVHIAKQQKWVSSTVLFTYDTPGNTEIWETVCYWSQNYGIELMAQGAAHANGGSDSQRAFRAAQQQRNKRARK